MLFLYLNKKNTCFYRFTSTNEYIVIGREFLGTDEIQKVVFDSGISTGDIERSFLDGNERVFSDRVFDDSEGEGLSDSAVSSDACSSCKLPASHKLCTKLHSQVSRTDPDWSSGSQ